MACCPECFVKALFSTIGGVMMLRLEWHHLLFNYMKYNEFKYTSKFEASLVWSCDLFYFFIGVHRGIALGAPDGHVGVSCFV